VRSKLENQRRPQATGMAGIGEHHDEPLLLTRQGQEIASATEAPIDACPRPRTCPFHSISPARRGLLIHPIARLLVLGHIDEARL